MEKEGLQCPKCQRRDDDKVIDTRKIGDGIQRTRRCACGGTFKTMEKVWTIKLYVIKRFNREREVYSEEKLRRSIDAAFTKRRNVNNAEINGMVERITEEVRRKGEEDVHSHDIGLLVLNELRQDPRYAVAYVRFASIFFGVTDPKQVQHLAQEVDKRLPIRAGVDSETVSAV